MTCNDPQHRYDDPVHRSINDPFIPDRSTNSHYVGMGLGIAAIVLLIIGATLWTPTLERSANIEPPANSTMTAPQLPSPDPSAAPSSRPASRPNG